MAKLSRKEVLHFLGSSPDQLGADLAAFSDAARVLSSDRPRLIDTNPQEWVGVFDGAVAASDKNLDKLMDKLASNGTPASQTIVRFIDNKEKTFLL